MNPSPSALRYGYAWAVAGLAPLLLAQGAWLRRRVPRLPEADGARQGEAGNGPPLRLLIAGDSAAAGVGVRHQQQALAGQLVQALAGQFHLHWQLVAQTGYTTPDLIARLQATAPAAFDVAIISIGVNDVTGGGSAGRWLDRQQELHTLLATRFQVQHVLRSSVPPMQHFPALPQPLRWYLGSRSRHFNHALRHFLRTQPQSSLVRSDVGGRAQDMAHDGFHPGPDIYARWAAALADSLRRQWPVPAAAQATAVTTD